MNTSSPIGSAVSALTTACLISVSNPVVHDFLDRGYWYFLTTSAVLEVRGKAGHHRPPRLVSPDPVPVIRRIND